MTDQSLTHSSLPDATCVFCELVAGRIPCDKVAEDATTLAFMDTDPGSDGHLLVIPKQHSADLLSVSAEDLVATTLAAQRIARAMYTQLADRLPFSPARDPPISRQEQGSNGVALRAWHAVGRRCASAVRAAPFRSVVGQMNILNARR